MRLRLTVLPAISSAMISLVPALHAAELDQVRLRGSSVYTADDAAGAIYDVVGGNTPPVKYLSHFPYLNHPYGGFEVPA